MSTPRIHKLPAYLIPFPNTEKESDGNSALDERFYFIPSGHSWGNCWHLTADLHVEVNSLQEEMVSITCLDLQEYGIGDSMESAITDLLTSLSDYYQSLESRQAKLAPPGVKDLNMLRHLLRISPNDSHGR